MMELMVASPIRAQLAQVLDWPKVPRTSLTESQIEISSSEPQKEERVGREQIPCDRELEAKRTATDSEQTSTQQLEPIQQPEPFPQQKPAQQQEPIQQPEPFPQQEPTQQQENTREIGASGATDDPAKTGARHTHDPPASRPTSHSESSPAPLKLVVTNSLESAKDGIIQRSSPSYTTTAQSSKPQKLAHRVSTLSRFALVKNQWPDPQLSIGAKCNRLGSNECWKAIGPAQELFNLISKSIEDLLDARVEDLEEGEPIAGHILLFDLYMIGKSPASAQPTLLFTCQRPKPRQRAIKFVKESRILNGHPKIALADSAVPPLAMGRSYVRLLADQTTPFARGRIPYPLPSPAALVPRTTATPATSSHLAVGAIIGVIVGVIGLVLVIGSVYVAHRLKQAIKVTSDAEKVTATRISTWQSPWRTARLAKINKKSVPDAIMHISYKEPMRVTHGSPNNTPSSYTSEATGGEGIPVFVDPKQLQPPTGVAALSNGLLGVPIVCPSTKMQSTIGAILHSKGKFYGLTVSHIFENAFNLLPDGENIPDNREDYSEFAFDEDNDDVQAIETIDVTVTSQASISDAESAETLSRSNTTISTISTARGAYSLLPNDTMDLHDMEINTSPSVSDATKRIGTLAYSTNQEQQFGLDWALIELSSSFVEYYRAVFLVSTDIAKYYEPSLIASKPERDVDVAYIRVGKGLSMGRISPGFTPMKLSPRSKFQDVWTVTFDSRLTQGDSGSAVVGMWSGAWYGHIVAGTPGGHIAYVIPAFKTFEDIRGQIGDFQFASEIFAAEVVESYARVDDMPQQDVLSKAHATIRNYTSQSIQESDISSGEVLEAHD